MADDQIELRPTPEIAKLLRDFRTSITNQVDAALATERATIAQTRADSMRSWLAILTAIVTLVIAIVALLLAGFGFLGYRTYTDIETAKQQVLKSSADVEKTAAALKATAEQGGTAAANVQPRIQEMESRLNALDSTIGTIQTKLDKLQRGLDAITLISQKNRIDTSNLQSNISAANGPQITRSPLELRIGTPVTLEGKDFGAKPGKLWVALQSSKPLGWTSNPQQEQKSAQTASIQAWSDSQITFVLSNELVSALNAEAHRESGDADAATGARLPIPNYSFLIFRVENSSGQSSLWSGAVPWRVMDP
jgi:hypothetical protein